MSPIESRDCFYNSIVVYNGPYTAHCLAKRYNAVAKHAALTGAGAGLETFSVVIEPTSRHHLEAQ